MELNLLPQYSNLSAGTMESVINAVHHTTLVQMKMQNILHDHSKQEWKQQQKIYRSPYNLCKFLMHYWSSPHAIPSKTLAELLFGRSIRTRLDLYLIQYQVTELTDKGAKDEVKIRRDQLKVGGLGITRKMWNGYQGK